MPIRIRNLDEFALPMGLKSGAALGPHSWAGGSIVLTPRVPFSAVLAAAILLVDTDPDANNADLKITDGSVDLTHSVNIASTAGDGTRHFAQGNGTLVTPGTELTLDITENGAIATFDGEVIIVFRNIVAAGLW